MIPAKSVCRRPGHFCIFSFTLLMPLKFSQTLIYGTITFVAFFWRIHVILHHICTVLLYAVVYNVFSSLHAKRYYFAAL